MSSRHPSRNSDRPSHGSRRRPEREGGVRPAHAEAGDTERALEELMALADRMAQDGSRSDRRRHAGPGGRRRRRRRRAGSGSGAAIYDQMRPSPGTAIVVRARGDLSRAGRHLPRHTRVDRGRSGPGGGALRGGAAHRPTHALTSLRGSGRGGAGPDVAPARPEGEGERVAVLLRRAEESAFAMGLHRLARRAAEPD